MEGFKKRLLEEHKELNKKCLNLKNTLNKHKAGVLPFELDALDVELLEKQFKFMSEYLRTLEARMGKIGIEYNCIKEAK